MTDGGVIPTDKQVRLIAAACHEVQQAYSRACGGPVCAWTQLSTDERELMIYGVRQVLRGLTPDALHQAWYEQRVASGWPLHAAARCHANRAHPDLVPYEQLADDERDKDQLFFETVQLMLDVMYGHDHG